MPSPFSSQFALSLELTRLLPINAVANKTAEVIMRYARDLRHSGSDLLTEEDLIGVFGRFRISPHISSSFKTIVSKSSSNEHILADIILQAGPGPTVNRALRDGEAAYLAMVIQLAFLTWTFDIHSLSGGLEECLRRRASDDKQDIAQITPTRESILTVAKACERQCAAYNWNGHLQAVGLSIGAVMDSAAGYLPSQILQGALDMFPMLQRFPDDRYVRVQIAAQDGSGYGISGLVVWAHHLLELRILVRLIGHSNGRKPQEVRFGSEGPEQILIEQVAGDRESSITLLDGSKDDLLTIRPEPDEHYPVISRTARIPALGWGTVTLKKEMEVSRLLASQQSVLEELQIIVVAFAQIISKHLVRDTSGRLTRAFPRFNREQHGIGGRIPCSIDDVETLFAANFLFDRQMSQEEIDAYRRVYASKPLNHKSPRPLSIDAFARDAPIEGQADVRDAWGFYCAACNRLAVYVLTFAQVSNKERLKDLVLCGVTFKEINRHNIAIQLHGWDGLKDIHVNDIAWLSAFSIPLIGRIVDEASGGSLDWNRTCLVSDRGWTAWIPTLAQMDPIFVNEGSFSIGPGSPYRNGVWKPYAQDLSFYDWDVNMLATKAEQAGQVMTARCAQEASFQRPYVGGSGDSFLITSRITYGTSSNRFEQMCLFGFRELHCALWWAKKTKDCLHPWKEAETMTLPPSCCTIQGFTDRMSDNDERIVILLTSGNTAARWFAVATAPWIMIDGEQIAPPRTEIHQIGNPRQIMLRGANCCLMCAIDQAARVPGKWIIIL